MRVQPSSNQTSQKRSARHAVLAIIASGLLALPSWQADAAPDSSGRVLSATGAVTADRRGDQLDLESGSSLFEGDKVSTGAGGRARLQMTGSVVQLDESSSLTVSSHNKRSRRTRIRLWSGRIWAKVASIFGGERGFEIETENAVAGVRGTSFMVQTRGDGSLLLTVFEGSVELDHSGTGKSRTFSAGQQAILTADGTFTVEEATFQDPLGDVTVKDEEAQRNRVPDEKKPEKSKEAVNRMKEILQEILGFLSEAREEGDLVKLNCVNEKLTAVKGLLRVAEQADINLQESLALRESGQALHEFDKVTIAQQKSEQLMAEAQACVGSLAIYSGDTQVEVVIQGAGGDDDPTETDVIVITPERPPAASPFQ